MAITFPAVFQSTVADDPAALAAGYLTPSRFNSGCSVAGLGTNQLLYSSGATTLAQSSNLTYDGTNLSVGTGIRLGDGTASAPAMAFASATGAGWYCQGGILKAAISGGDVGQFDANGLTLQPSKRIVLGSGILGGGTAAVLYSSTAPTIASGFGTSPSISHQNGSGAFELTIGTSTTGVQTGTITMPSTTTAWVCDCVNVTNPDTSMVVQTGGTNTTITLKNYNRTTGLAADFTASDVIRIKALGY